MSWYVWLALWTGISVLTALAWYWLRCGWELYRTERRKRAELAEFWSER